LVKRKTLLLFVQSKINIFYSYLSMQNHILVKKHL